MIREELRLHCLDAAVAVFGQVKATDVTDLAEELYQWVIEEPKTKEEPEEEGAIE